MYHLKSRWQIPMEVTTYGSLSGLLGPVFLLAPLGLLALRRREGRQLWLAALVFGAELLQQHRDAVSDSAAALRGAGDDAGAERRAATGGGGGGGVGSALLAGDGAALRPRRRLAPGQNSVARGAAHPARGWLPGSATSPLSEWTG